MSESILITVPYKNTEKQFEIELQVTGYTHRFKVMIDDIPVFFEPDEERWYRAVLLPENAEAAKRIDVILLQSIAEILHNELS